MFLALCIVNIASSYKYIGEKNVSVVPQPKQYTAGSNGCRGPCPRHCIAILKCTTSV